MISNWQQLKLLLWKNFTIQKRSKIQTLLEILLPAYFMAILLVVRTFVDVEYHEVQHYDFVPTNLLDPLRESYPVSPKIIWEVAYAPNNTILESLVKTALVHLKIANDTQIKPFSDSSEMETYLHHRDAFAGIEFDEALANITELPEVLTFALRFPSELRTRHPLVPVELMNWFTHLRFPLFEEYGARNSNETDGGIPTGYWREGFIPLQASLSYAFVKAWQQKFHPGIVELPPVMLHRFPNPPYVNDALLKGLEFLLPMLTTLSLMISVIYLVKNVVLEKELQLKEAMRIMGLTNWIHWVAWFIKSFSIMLVTVSLITLLLKVPVSKDGGAVLNRTDWTVLWCYLAMFCVPTVAFSFLVSVFFNKANVAALCSGLIWLILYAPYTSTALHYDTMSLMSKLLVCLSSNAGLVLGFHIIIRYEGVGVGLQWHNFSSPVNADDNLSVLHTMVMFYVDAFLYILLLVYFEKILTHGAGRQQPWYFPLKVLSRRKADVQEQIKVGFPSFPNVDKDINPNRVGVCIENLGKVYSNGKTAVRSLNMRLYKDQITVLLGHNGAGKSTTISMLTGLLTPTTGTAVINGYDILQSADQIRESFGFCPQHNILFDNLTVREHIYFFASLKGLNQREADVDLERFVQRLELNSKVDSLAKTLSGGQKRKLSVAAALCGNSSVVLLDEPTSGMDPSARRLLWDLLAEEKQGRTILLSTHYMDEADVLGDKIAILSDGELECMGSSFYLKKRYGAGYRLICVKKSGCDITKITEMLQGFIPDIRVETNVGAELTYMLNEEYTSVFKNMFQALEKHQEELLISSFGVSLKTLEEVFMKVGADRKMIESKVLETVETNLNMNDSEDQLNYESTAVLDDQFKTQMLTGDDLIWNQAKGMLLKRWSYTRRNPLEFVIVNLIVVIFVILSLLAYNNIFKQADLPAIKLDVDFYEQTTTILEVTEKAESTFILLPLISSYGKIIKKVGGNHAFQQTNRSFASEIIELGSKSLRDVNTKYLFGATADVINYNNLTIPFLTCWFNNQGYHTAPISVNLMYNAMLQYMCPNCSINVYNKPLPYKLVSKKNVIFQGTSFGFQIAYNTGIALAFVSGFFSIFYLKERTSKAKLLQYVSGAKVFVFWFVSFLWDYLIFSIITAVYLLTLWISNQPDWSTVELLWNMAVIMACFAWGSLPVIYLASLIFTKPTTGFVRLTIFFLFSGVVLYLFVGLLYLPFVDMKELFLRLSSYFLVFPHFAIVNSINRMDWIIVPRDICRIECKLIPNCTLDNISTHLKECYGPQKVDFFDYEWPGIGEALITMFWVGIVSWVVLLFIELGSWKRIVSHSKGRTSNTIDAATVGMDSDVVGEKVKVCQIAGTTDSEKYNLIIKNFSKNYGDVVAVKDLSIAVGASECFGLLGLNGAGKTTTFKMLTGDINIPIGDAWVQGRSIKDDMTSVYQTIGYCPQFDALLGDLTGYENLKIFALLRGIPPQNTDFIIRKLATDLNLQKHIHQQVKQYSGGNKRKLSAAVAIVGNPAVIYLDEPTSGMDVATRRLLWNMIAKLREEGRSIVLTSHSMEECEALCTRLAIMVNGEFRCLGSTQHLKNKFSKGYTLTVKLKKSWNKEIKIDLTCYSVKEFISRYFVGSVLREEHMDLLTYHVPSTELTWSEMFGIMEKAKDTLSIEDYSIGQTSLEQVFLYFAKNQKVPVDELAEMTIEITRL